MPAVDRLLAGGIGPLRPARANRPAIEEAARAFARQVTAAGPDHPLVLDLTGVAEPLLGEHQDDGRYLGPEARAEIQS